MRSIAWAIGRVAIGGRLAEPKVPNCGTSSAFLGNCTNILEDMKASQPRNLHVSVLAQGPTFHSGDASELDRRSRPHFVLNSFRVVAWLGNLRKPEVAGASNSAIVRAAPALKAHQVTDFLQVAAGAGWKPPGEARDALRATLLRCLPEMTHKQVASSLASAVKLGFAFRNNCKLFQAAEDAIYDTLWDMDKEDLSLIKQFVSTGTVRSRLRSTLAGRLDLSCYLGKDQGAEVPASD